MGKQTKKQKHAIKKALVMLAFAENIPVVSKHKSKKSKWVLAIEPSWQWHTTKYKIDPDYRGRVPAIPVPIPVYPNKADTVTVDTDDCPFDAETEDTPNESTIDLIPYIGTQCIHKSQLCVLLDLVHDSESDTYTCDLKYLATERIENEIPASEILFMNPEVFAKWQGV